MPLRKKPFTPKQQLFWLRIAIVSVAIFAFFFSFYYGQVTYILMFMAITGAIWLGGAGIVIIGGLYWKRGTTAGAWTGLFAGSSLAVLGLLGTNYWAGHIYPVLERHPAVLRWITYIIEGTSKPFRPYVDWRVTPDKFPINGQEMLFITILTATLSYVIVSLLSCREPFNMDRMLHRGKYRRESGGPVEKPPRSLKGMLRTLLGTTPEFTHGDRILSWSVLIYSLGWGFASWLVVLLWNIIKEGGWPNHWWSTWFFISNVVVAGVIGLVSTFWLSIGSALGLRDMFRRLAAHRTDVLDSGRVVGHVSANDVAMVEQIEHKPIEQAHKYNNENNKPSPEEPKCD